MRRIAALGAALAGAGWLPMPAAAQVAGSAGAAAALPTAPMCANGTCQVRLTPAQLLERAQIAVQARDFATAQPLVDALSAMPEYSFETRFLDAYIATETGNLPKAEKLFRGLLSEQPRTTRVRLELAHVLQLMGRESAADYHYRLAEQSGDLPDEVARTIRAQRGILRDSRMWRFSFDFGLAPDTNINSATNAETVLLNFGPIQLPLELDDQAKRKSGVGQTGSYSAGLRIRTEGPLALLIESDGRFTNYRGTFADDFGASIGAGPELKIGARTTASLVGTVERRWYGGRLASSDYGLRLGGEVLVGRSQRVGVAIDGRHTKSGIADAYTGWQVGANVTYERVVARSFVATASLYGRRDFLDSPATSNKSFGLAVGIGGELPFGVNAGVSATAGVARYDQPQYIYSDEARRDRRYTARAYAGLRDVRLFGFSPSIDYSFSKVDSNYTLYASTRHRVNFKLARYF